MARTITLANIRARIRARAEVRDVDLDNSPLNDWINESYAEFYDLLVSADPDWFLTSGNITVVAGTSSYALPDTFYLCQGCDVLDSGSIYYALSRFNFSERNKYGTSTTDKRLTQYSVRGSSLYLIPTPAWSGTIKLWFVAAPAVASGDSSTFDGVAGWDEYIVIDTLIKIYAKDEMDASLLVDQKNRLIARIKQMASNRDLGEPKRVRNADAEGMTKWPNYWFP